MLSQQITPGRVVALLTPLVFAPAAGAISVAAAKYLPGVNVDAGKLQAIFIAGATVALGQGALWLKGWQDYEKRQEATPPGVSNDMRLEETQTPRSTIADAAPAAANGSAVAVDAGSLENDGLDEELLADGFDEDLGDDTEPAADDDLVLSGRE
ncbi:MAG: hypothetical protein QOJ12_622 [Thermoleophilales bacterium]|jgi:hypothetical protein|nr:hypothetical protein [Thermoleophilales bacterium]